jgi:hypothetical protein
MEENIIVTSEIENEEAQTEEENKSAEENSEQQTECTNDTVNYDELAKADLEELKAIFPELSEISSITMIENPLRYAALRDLGLSAKEAYLATNAHKSRYDNRSHLNSAVPGGAAAPKSSMSVAELDAARELFGQLSDREIQKLYKKVTR